MYQSPQYKWSALTTAPYGRETNHWCNICLEKCTEPNSRRVLARVVYYALHHVWQRGAVKFSGNPATFAFSWVYKSTHFFRWAE